jgi:polyadenylate-binding protein
MTTFLSPWTLLIIVQAVEKLNGTEINGKQIYVGRAQKRQERDEELRHQRDEHTQKYQGANVYVKVFI